MTQTCLLGKAINQFYGMLKQYLKSCVIVFCVIYLCTVHWSMAQNNGTTILKTDAIANFGVDADVKSDILSFSQNNGVGTDDWFLGPDSHGFGVINVTDLSNIEKIGELSKGLNVPAMFRMSQTDNPNWLDAVFLRDYYSHNNEKDNTIFGGGNDKNFDDPTTWTIKKGSVPPKNDIIDVYGHLRTDSNQTDLWVFGAVSTRTQNGDNYIDFEYFRKPITLNPNDQHLTSDGLQNGHTAYKFNLENGSVITDGDVILSVNYINGGSLAEFRFYAWIDADQIKGLDGDPSSLSDADFVSYNENFLEKRFDFGYGTEIGDYQNYIYDFYNCNNDPNIPYGYARISLLSDVTSNPIFAQDNTVDDVEAPTWGTIGPDGNVSNTYVSPSFIEFALNASLLGLDSNSNIGNCSGPLGHVLVKSRASASFTSELKDLAGPFTLGVSPENTITISQPDTLTCSVTEITLTALTTANVVSNYEWFKDGKPFDDGTPGNELTVTEPGKYYVNAMISESCTVKSNEVEVFQNSVEPNVTANGGEIKCSIGRIRLDGTISSTNPDAELVFEWSGPNGYLNTTELNPYVSVIGTYILTVTDNNNGCINIATAEVTTESVVLLEIQCPQGIEVQCVDEIPQPDINAVIIINGGEGGQPIVEFVSDSSDNGSCPETVTRTYSATDACGNIVYCSQTITVNDTTRPVLAAAPIAISVQCIEDVPPPTSLGWTDNCDAGGSVFGVDGPLVGGECGGTITRTWNVMDSCMNAAETRTQIITVSDTIGPEIVDVADYRLEGCATEWPEFLTTTWTDNCSTGGSIDSDAGIYKGSSADGSIEYREYTFTVKDACDNTATEKTVVSRLISNGETIEGNDIELNLGYGEFDLYDLLPEGYIPGGNWLLYSTNPDGLNIEISNSGSIFISDELSIGDYVFHYTIDCTVIEVTVHLLTTSPPPPCDDGEKIIGNEIELCRDYGEYDLSLLLPEDYNIPGGTWILYSTNPQGLDIVISDYGLIFVSEEITPGIYVFHYKLECIYIEVNVKILEDINCVKDCEGGEISTALTPNGDRVNDTFYAGVDPGGSCTVDVQIFNRWGAKVFEAQNYQNDWSGTVNSNAIGSAGKITTGTYYYILRYKTDGEVEQTLTGYFYVATE